MIAHKITGVQPMANTMGNIFQFDRETAPWTEWTKKFFIIPRKTICGTYEIGTLYHRTKYTEIVRATALSRILAKRRGGITYQYPKKKREREYATDKQLFKMKLRSTDV